MQFRPLLILFFSFNLCIVCIHFTFESHEDFVKQKFFYYYSNGFLHYKGSLKCHFWSPMLTFFRMHLILYEYVFGIFFLRKNQMYTHLLSPCFWIYLKPKIIASYLGHIDRSKTWNLDFILKNIYICILIIYKTSHDSLLSSCLCCLKIFLSLIVKCVFRIFLENILVLKKPL